MRRLAPLFLATALLAAGPLAAQPAPEPERDRTVAFELREGGRLVAAPSVTVRIGRPAAISVGEYSLRLRVTRAAAGKGPYLVRSSLYRSASGWTLVASPAVTVLAGEQAHLNFAGNDGSDLSLAVLVR